MTHLFLFFLLFFTTIGWPISAQPFPIPRLAALPQKKRRRRIYLPQVLEYSTNSLGDHISYIYTPKKNLKKKDVAPKKEESNSTNEKIQETKCQLQKTFLNSIPPPPKDTEHFFDDIDSPEFKKNIEGWKSAFQSLVYCDVMSRFDVDWHTDFILHILYFTSASVYGISKESDLHCGLEKQFDNEENRKHLHEVIVNFKDLTNLPEIFNGIKEELTKVWKNE